MAKETTVINVGTGEDYDVYIGRGSPFGNPYPIGECGDRSEVLSKYEYDLKRGFLRCTDKQILALRGKVLGCHCKPLDCHGDILIARIKELEEAAD